MKDIKLDFTTKHLVNETIDGKKRVIQQITVAVRTWLKDFFLNEYFGVDYDNCWGNTTLLELYIKEQTEAIPGVFTVNSVSVARKKTFDGITYFQVDINITYENEILDISEEITGR